MTLEEQLAERIEGEIRRWAAAIEPWRHVLGEPFRDAHHVDPLDCVGLRHGQRG